MLAALIAGVAACLWFPPGSLERLALDVLPSAVSATAILAGLMAIAHTVLLALDDKPVILYLKDEGYYGTLIDYQIASFRTQLIFIAACLLVMVLRVANFHPTPYLQIAPAVLAFLGTWAGSCTWRQMDLMFKLLRKKDGAGR